MLPPCAIIRNVSILQSHAIMRSCVFSKSPSAYVKTNSDTSYDVQVSMSQCILQVQMQSHHRQI